MYPSAQRDGIASPGSRAHQRHPGHADAMVATGGEGGTPAPGVLAGVVVFDPQAQDARGDHAVEPRLRPRRHRHPGGGGEEADEREGHEPP